MILAALKFIFGGFLNRALAKIDSETERQRITGEVVSRYIAAEAENRAVAMQSRVFWWVWALFAAPVGIWFGAVCLDSVAGFSGHIADLPPSVKPYATQIVASIFGSGGAVAGLQAVASAIRGRR